MPRRKPDAQLQLFDSHETVKECPVLSKGHHPVKMNGDESWWCTGCGEKNLPEPDLKSWERIRI